MPASQTRLQELCHYTLRPDGIHEFRLTVASRASWDAYVELMIEVIQDSLDQSVICTIIDLTCGTVPLAHAAITYRDFVKRFPKRPPIRYAVLHGDNFLMALAASIVKTVKSREDEIHLFHINYYDTAVAWLHKS